MLAKVNSSAVVGLDAMPSETDNRIYNSERIKDLDDEWRSVPAKHPSWYCKRRKGRHEFLLVKEEDFGYFLVNGKLFGAVAAEKRNLSICVHPIPRYLQNNNNF